MFHSFQLYYHFYTVMNKKFWKSLLQTPSNTVEELPTAFEKHRQPEREREREVYRD